MDDWILAQDDPRRTDVLTLLERHLDFARTVTPPEDVHALDLDGLLDESVTLFSLREKGALLGIGAMKTLDGSHMELKSIHTAAEARGRGVGRTIVDHLVSVARSKGATRVSLETGSMPEFAPSRALYARAGFVECGPFAEYSGSRNSTFMTLDLH
ncbi:MAG TPA: GNAT family N-acetyltransferase [Acidimicrobiia bacterium]|nr:GNAT family N-acetyltransferase [Acidimicrobiia bacterium]